MISGKEGVNVDNMDKVYNYMKYCFEKYGTFIHQCRWQRN